MKNKILTLVLVTLIMATGMNVFASPQVGDQTFTNMGAGVYVSPSGVASGQGVSQSTPGGPITVTVTNRTEVPNGTTKANISFDPGKIANMSPDVNKNGHAFANGQDALNKIGDLRPPSIVPVGTQTVAFDAATGKTYITWSAQVTVSPLQVSTNLIAPTSAIAMAKTMAGSNMPRDAKLAGLVANLKANYSGTHPNPDLTAIAENLLADPLYFDKQSFMMMNLPGLVEVLDTEEAELKRAQDANTPIPPASSTDCPTGPYWNTIPMSRREFLYTSQTTTDLPTPPTRNHGACPAADNAGFSEWDPAWGAGFFPVAGPGEHWKYWDATNKDKGYNKSIHYETRGLIPAATNPGNVIKGRPVATTGWTPISDAHYDVFVQEPVGKIDYTWIDNSAQDKNSAIAKTGTNQTKYCVEAYERLLIPEKQIWIHDHYQIYEWNFCQELWSHDSPADKHCNSYTEECTTSTDKDGVETESCSDVCDGWDEHDVGYHYKEYDPKGGYNTPEWDGGMTTDTSMGGRIPPVYEPWRKWKHRTEIQVEFHASIINENSNLRNFNKLSNPQIKSGYGTLFEGTAAIITDWDRNITLDANLVRPNKTTPLSANSKNEPLFDANGSAPEGVSGSIENKNFIRDSLQIAGSGATINYSTKMGTWHAFPQIKGNQQVIPKFGKSRQHFIHVDYPDGQFNTEAWIDAFLTGGQSSWKVNHAAFRGLPVRGNMFSDSFVRPK